MIDDFKANGLRNSRRVPEGGISFPPSSAINLPGPSTEEIDEDASSNVHMETESEDEVDGVINSLYIPRNRRQRGKKRALVGSTRRKRTVESEDEDDEYTQ